MKRVWAFILCAAMLLTTLCGCTTLKKDENGDLDKGAYIPLFLGTEMYNFDPGIAYLNDTNVQLLSMLYVGLTDIDEKGKLQMTLIDNYKVTENEELGEYKMTINMKHTRWSDGIALTAENVVYAFKRLLNVNYDSEAAVLLFDIKNARAIKNGEMSIDDLGATAPETYKVEIEFERKIDYTQFLRNLSSPALVPLREDIVAKSTTGEHWAKMASSLVTSGPFSVRVLEFEGVVRFDRSNYYFLDEDDKYADKYVIPYRLETNYSTRSGIENTYLDMMNMETPSAFYVNELPLDKRAEYKDSVEVTDLLSTHTLYLNLHNEIFADANVRKALSAALDREQIANDIVFAKPATGFVPYKVINDKKGTSFRETADASGALIDTKANAETAKSLLSQAGVSGGSLQVAYFADDPVSQHIAEAAKAAWEPLGFTVTLVPKTMETVTEGEGDEAVDYYYDRFHELYSVQSASASEWDVLAIDYQALCEEAFYALAPFAVGFSGNGVDMTDRSYPPTGHITGFADEAYDKLIEEAYELTDPAERAAKLHEAEAKLMELMPVIPVVFNQAAHYYNKNILSGFSTDYYGATSFNRVKMKNYMDWKAYFGVT